jgi:Mrp family chromosome partitioning ATPase
MLSATRDKPLWTIEVSEMLGFVHRNWQTITRVAGLSLALALIIILVTPQKYTATAQLLINPPREKTLGPEGSLADPPLDPSSLENQVLLIRSAALLETVIKQEDLMSDPEFASEPASTLFQRLRHVIPGSARNENATDNKFDRSLNSLREAITVERIGKSYVIALSVITSSPLKSVRLANVTSQAFVSDYLDSQSGINRRALRIINPATLPNGPSQPNKKLILSLGLFCGVMIGVAWTALRELRRSGYISREEVETSLGVPVLSLLEVAAEKVPKRVRIEQIGPGQGLRPIEQILIGAPSRLDDGICELFYRLNQIDKAASGVVILFSSAVKGEGVTTVSHYLAAFASMTGKKAVVVDCHLRKIGLAGESEQDIRVGVREFVDDNYSLDKVISRCPDTGIDIVPAGRPTLDPFPTISAPRFAELFIQLKQSYDLIMIDSPPMNQSFDSALVSDHADATILLIRWNETPRRLVQEALRRLGGRRKRIFAVLNFVNVTG